MAGGQEGARAQQAPELRALTTPQLDQLLVDAGVKPPPGKAAASGLAIKANLKLPWHQMRKLQRWLKHFGVTVQSERSMRTQVAAELPLELLAEYVPLATKKKFQ